MYHSTCNRMRHADTFESKKINKTTYYMVITRGRKLRFLLMFTLLVMREKYGRLIPYRIDRKKLFCVLKHIFELR